VRPWRSVPIATSPAGTGAARGFVAAIVAMGLLLPASHPAEAARAATARGAEGTAPAIPDVPEAKLWGTARSVLGAAQLSVMLPDRSLLQVSLLGVVLPDPPRAASVQSPGQPFGAEAATYLRGLVLDKQVRLDVYAKERGRALAVVWLGDLNVNLTLVKEGLAWIDPALANPHVRAPLEVAERQARVGQYGLWSLPNPEAPWDYRRRLGLPPE
jgi:endonuclease YncB( thermonuclease family)